MKTLLTNLLLSAVAVLAPIKALLLVVTFLLAADFVTGILKSLKKGGIAAIKSKVMSQSIYKIVGYNLLIISAFLVEKYIIDGVMPLSKMATALVGLVEFKSLSENISAITGVDVTGLAKKLQHKDNE